MIPIELELRNFLAYRNPGPLRFEGIHVACLAGPNGAGKSSLLDAMTWALWGKARSSSPDDLIHQGQTEMRVEFTFEQQGQRYRVVRQRKAGKRGTSLLELQAWDAGLESWRGLSEATMRATQAKIDAILRLDYETFVNSAFLVQGRADEFTTKTPGQRKQVLSNILGLSLWEQYERRAKEKIGSTQAGIQRLEGRLEEIERELANREVYEAELKSAEEAAGRVAEDLAAAEKQWADLEQARADLVKVQRQIDDLTRRITAAEKEISETEGEREEALARADKQALHAALEGVQEQVSHLETVQQEHDERQGARAQMAEEAAALRGTNAALTPETEPLKARVATLESATDPICPTCGQPLTEEHRAALIADLEQEIEARRQQYRENQERIKHLEAETGALDRVLAQAADQLKARSGFEKRAGELEAALAHADDAAQLAETLGTKIARWRADMQADAQRRAGLEQEVEESEARLKAARLTQEDVDELRLRKRYADERVGGARQKLSALESYAEQRRARLSEHESLTRDLGLYGDLREAFSKRGVPAMIIETVVPELERSANELLTRMTDGRLHVRIETQREIKTGELREALDIIISDELGSRPYELYSGGEAFRINFATRIALSRLLANRAGAQLRSLFIDEGFGTQDARGREQLIEAINSIQDDFDRILVITHIEEMKEAFPARIEVTKTPEGSRFELA